MGKLSAQLAQCFTDANCTQHNVRLHQVSQPGRRGLVREPNEKNNPTHGRRAAGHTRKSVLVERYATRNYVLGKLHILAPVVDWEEGWGDERNVAPKLSTLATGVDNNDEMPLLRGFKLHKWRERLEICNGRDQLPQAGASGDHATSASLVAQTTMNR